MPQLQIHLYTKFRLEGSASFNPQEGGLLPPSKHREGGLPPPSFQSPLQAYHKCRYACYLCIGWQSPLE